jgi:hypothetical protein
MIKVFAATWFVCGSKAFRLRGSDIFSRPSFADLLRDFHQREHGGIFGELPFNREVSVFPEQRNLNVFRLVPAKFRKTGRRIFNAKRLRCLVVAAKRVYVVLDLTVRNLLHRGASSFGVLIFRKRAAALTALSNNRPRPGASRK